MICESETSKDQSGRIRRNTNGWRASSTPVCSRQQHQLSQSALTEGHGCLTMRCPPPLMGSP